MKRLKLYSNPSWLPPGYERLHVTALCPFWGRTEAGSAGWPDYADELIARGPEFLELVELKDADLAVFPLAGRTLLRDPRGPELACAFAAAAREAGKTTVFFIEPADTRGHLDPPFPVDDALVLRGSLFRSRRGGREFALPGFHDDLVSTGAHGTLPLRRKGNPVVSFCGGVIREPPAPRRARARGRRMLGDIRRSIWRMQGRHEEDLFTRARAVDALLRQVDVEASIIVRESGGGGTWAEFDRERWKIARKAWAEFDRDRWEVAHKDYLENRSGSGHEEDLFARTWAVDGLPNQVDVETSAVVRESSGGGGAWTERDRERWKVARREYLENMLASDYVLCARGDGNWSVRFYEAMCLGRIPVVVDTDLVMPYDFLLDWRDYGVWIDRSDIDDIGAHVAAFHERLSESEFQDLQRECRGLWERYLSPPGFFGNFHRHLEVLAG